MRYPGRKRKVLTSFIAFLFFLLPASVCMALTDVAIYNDTGYVYNGAWSHGVSSIKSMLSTYGYTYSDITPTEINQSSNLSDSYRMLLVPGGWAEYYNLNITPLGYHHIRSFVARGGAYFGICAGAYFASDIVMWKEGWSESIESYNYPLDLFSGIGAGAVLGITGWNTPTGCNEIITEGAAMTTLSVDTELLPGSNSTIEILYYGGPMFWGNLYEIPDFEVLARYSNPGDRSDQLPAMIMFGYGQGKVFLSGPHPEVSFNTSSCTLYHDAANWALMHQVIDQLIN